MSGGSGSGSGRGHGNTQSETKHNQTESLCEFQVLGETRDTARRFGRVSPITSIRHTNRRKLDRSHTVSDRLSVEHPCRRALQSIQRNNTSHHSPTKFQKLQCKSRFPRRFSPLSELKSNGFAGKPQQSLKNSPRAFLEILARINPDSETK